MAQSRWVVHIHSNLNGRCRNCYVYSVSSIMGPWSDLMMGRLRTTLWGKWSIHSVLANALSNFSITNSSPCCLFIQVKGRPLELIGMRHRFNKVCWSSMLPAIAWSLKVSLSNLCRTWLKSPIQAHLWRICLPKFWRSV
jgi:hypothetical protein